MMIVAHDAPDFRTIADFRKRHLPPLGRLFLQVLKLAEKAGLAKLGHVALDGTKIKAPISNPHAVQTLSGRAPSETKGALIMGNNLAHQLIADHLVEGEMRLAKKLP